MSTIQELADLAVKAADIQHNLDDAIASSTNAEIAAIEAVIAKVKPALKSIAGRMKIHYHSWWVGNTHTDEEVEYYSVKGVKLVNGHEYHKDSTGNSGDVVGTNVYLLVDGSLAKFEYSGHWSYWQGSSDEWEAEVTGISIEEYVRDWGGKLEDVVSILEEKFKGVIKGKAPEKTKTNLERAKKLNAIKELL
jgi:hypothetical protein